MRSVRSRRCPPPQPAASSRSCSRVAPVESPCFFGRGYLHHVVHIERSSAPLVVVAALPPALERPGLHGPSTALSRGDGSAKAEQTALQSLLERHPAPVPAGPTARHSRGVKGLGRSQALSDDVYDARGPSAYLRSGWRGALAGSAMGSLASESLCGPDQAPELKRPRGLGS